MDWKAQPARTWLLVGLTIALAHAGAWYALDRLRDEAKPARALTVIEAALLPPPAPVPAPRPLPVAPPVPKKPAPPPPRSEPPRPPPIPAPTPSPIAVPIEAPVPAPVQVVATAPASEPVAPAPEAAAPVSVSPAPPPAIEAPRFNAAYLNNPPPEYPFVARRRGLEGRVLVRAEVLADGRCNRVELKHGSGHALLDEAALEAVRKWRFVPARQGEQAVSAWVDVPIVFKLKN
jgi:protein TonB